MRKDDLIAYLDGMIEQLDRSEPVHEHFMPAYWDGYRKAVETVLTWAKEHE
jgi:hypothetical protein